MMSKKQVAEKIIELKRVIAIYENVLNTETDGKTGRPLGSTTYTQEQIDFLKTNAFLTDNEIIRIFNEKFKTSIPHNSRQLYNVMQRQGIGR